MTIEPEWQESGDYCRGYPILFSLVRDWPGERCVDCDAGVCVQRVERCEAWESDLVIHAAQREMA